MALCQRATVLRQGRVVAKCVPSEESARRLAELMIGEELRVPEHGAGQGGGATRLELAGLDLPSGQQLGTDLHEIALAVGAGEILGIAGIAGNGQSELMAALSGEVACAADQVRLDGAAIGGLGPEARRRRGMAFVPEERNGHAAVAGLSLTENTLLSTYQRHGMLRWGLIDRRRAAGFARQVIARFDVRTRGPEAEARSLSGGNLQRFVVGREILQEPGVLIVNQPTWGVDAGAAATIHQALLDLARGGAAVLVISQDLDEIFALCDRIAVIAGGRLSPARPIREVTVEEIGLLMGGRRTGGFSGGEAAHV
jgi:simple sugar transport system ATP-binding protein